MSACVWVIHPPNLGLLFFILLLCHGNHGSFKEDKRYNHFWLMHTFSWGPGQYLQSPIWQSISSKWRLRVEEHLVMLRCLFYPKGAKCMSWYHLGCLFSNSSICCHNYCIVQQGLYLSSFMLYKGNNREWQVFIFERTSCPLSPSSQCLQMFIMLSILHSFNTKLAYTYLFFGTDPVSSETCFCDISTVPLC